jgi:hypothetical protein
MGEKRNVLKFESGSLKRKDHLGDGVDGKIILQWIVKR